MATAWRRRTRRRRVIRAPPVGAAAGETREAVTLRRARRRRSASLRPAAASAAGQAAGGQVDRPPRIAMFVPGLCPAIAFFTAARIVGIFSAGSSSMAITSSSDFSRARALRISSSRWSAASCRGDSARSRGFGVSSSILAARTRMETPGSIPGGGPRDDDTNHGNRPNDFCQTAECRSFSPTSRSHTLLIHPVISCWTHFRTTARSPLRVGASAPGRAARPASDVCPPGLPHHAPGAVS